MDQEKKSTQQMVDEYFNENKKSTDEMVNEYFEQNKPEQIKNINYGAPTENFFTNISPNISEINKFALANELMKKKELEIIGKEKPKRPGKIHTEEEFRKYLDELDRINAKYREMEGVPKTEKERAIADVSNVAWGNIEPELKVASSIGAGITGFITGLPKLIDYMTSPTPRKGFTPSGNISAEQLDPKLRKFITPVEKPSEIQPKETFAHKGARWLEEKAGEATEAGVQGLGGKIIRGAASAVPSIMAISAMPFKMANLPIFESVTSASEAKYQGKDLNQQLKEGLIGSVRGTILAGLLHKFGSMNKIPSAALTGLTFGATNIAERLLRNEKIDIEDVVADITVGTGLGAVGGGKKEEKDKQKIITTLKNDVIPQIEKQVWKNKKIISEKPTTMPEEIPEVIPTEKSPILNVQPIPPESIPPPPKTVEPPIRDVPPGSEPFYRQRGILRNLKVNLKTKEIQDLGEDIDPGTMKMGEEGFYSYNTQTGEIKPLNPNGTLEYTAEKVIKENYKVQPRLEKKVVEEIPENIITEENLPSFKPIKQQIQELENIVNNLKPTSNKNIIIQRIEEPNIETDFNKPQGLYVHPGEIIGSHEDLGGTKKFYEINPKNILDVTKVDSIKEGEKLRRNASGLSAGFNAAKILEPEITNLFVNFKRSEIIKKLKFLYPKINWERYYDNVELIETFGAIKAKEKGYDLLVNMDYEVPESSEFVILDKNIINKEVKPIPQTKLPTKIELIFEKTKLPIKTVKQQIDELDTKYPPDDSQNPNDVKVSKVVTNSFNKFEEQFPEKTYPVHHGNELEQQAEINIQNEGIEKRVEKILQKKPEEIYDADVVESAKILNKLNSNENDIKNNFGKTQQILDKIKQSGTKAGQTIKAYDFAMNVLETPEYHKQRIIDETVNKIPKFKKRKQESEKIADNIKNEFSKIDKESGNKEYLDARKKKILDRMFADKKIKPKEKKELFEKILQLDDLGALDKPELYQKIAEKFGVPTLTPETVLELRTEANKILLMPEGRDKTIAILKFENLFKKDIPVSLGRKIETIQTLHMLLNGPTTMRNIGGNITTKAMEYFSHIVLGVPLDKLTALITHNRSVTIPSLFDFCRGFGKGIKYAAEDVINRIDSTKLQIKNDFGVTIDKETDNMFEHRRQGRTFKNPIYDTMEKLLGFTLELPDRAFFEGQLYEAIYERLKVEKMNGDIPDGWKGNFSQLKHVDDIIKSSVHEAAKVTFKDNNAVSELFIALKKDLNKLTSHLIPALQGEHGAGSYGLKFPRVPGAIISRMYEFSPLAFPESLWKLAKVIAKKNLGVNAQRDAILRMAQSLTGTGLAFLGYALAQAGVATGSRHDKEKLNNFNDAIGKLKNAIKVNIGGKTHFISWDQFVPSSGTFAMGVETGKEQEGKKNIFNHLVDIIGAGIKILSEQPLMTGFERMIGSYASGQQESKLISGLKTTAASALSTFIPSLAGRLRYLTDVEKRQIPKDFVGQLKFYIFNKIPGLSQTLTSRLDVFGRPIEVYRPESKVWQWLNTMINPVIISKMKEDPALKFVDELYRKTKNLNVLPPNKKEYFMIAGTKFSLTADEANQIQMAIGNASLMQINKLVRLLEKVEIKGKKVPNEMKIELVRSIYKVAAKVGKNEILRLKAKDIVPELLKKAKEKKVSVEFEEE